MYNHEQTHPSFDFHNQKQADITIITHLTNHPEDSDCIIESPSLSISKYKLKNIPDKNKSFYLGNAGISVLKKKVIIKLKKELDFSNKEISLFRDIVIKGLNNNFKVFSYNTSEYLKDMGTPDRLRTVENDIRKNLVTQKSYKTKQKVLFLDRDNTIIECPEKKYITKKEQIIIFKNRVREIAKISKDFDFALIITNQPQISMGLTSWQNVIELNGIIINQCFLLGLEISGVYLCPHHPHADYKNEVKHYKVNCFCRKPLPGLFYEASYWRNIDLKSSLLIGDSKRDYNAAKNVGMKFIHTNNL